ncbi:hypothetical protein CHH57_01915 [Niallia circulans]|uniref:Uncharacterized protein n=1 Tax=Niallia circulans TaxID=1397 RepID=A0AA91Z2Y6_NIACI|nr:hypothetical protein [Niallia circulans]PAD84954.1 hypothetical protein CHH57_01915 [Niallia circulans]
MIKKYIKLAKDKIQKGKEYNKQLDKKKGAAGCLIAVLKILLSLIIGILFLVIIYSCDFRELEGDSTKKADQQSKLKASQLACSKFNSDEEIMKYWYNNGQWYDDKGLDPDKDTLPCNISKVKYEKYKDKMKKASEEKKKQDALKKKEKEEQEARTCKRDIKGNISSSGEKIYHIPGGDFYDKTVAEETFCTQADAAASGYRKSKR